MVDKNGHLVTNLPQSAFTVYENGVQQPIKMFKREDVPVSHGADHRQQRQHARQARQGGSRGAGAGQGFQPARTKSSSSISTTRPSWTLPHGKDFTNDIKEMEEALTRIDSRGGTAMRDAIRMSIDHLKEKAHKDKKVLVVVTDGNDNASVISLENLVKASQQSEVLIYCDRPAERGRAARSASAPSAR